MENNKIIWIIAPIVVLLVLLFGGAGMGGYSMMPMMGGMGFGVGFGPIFMLLFWGIIIWIIVTLINTNQSNKDELDSIAILKKRFAKGEITKKEFEDMKKELMK